MSARSLNWSAILGVVAVVRSDEIWGGVEYAYLKPLEAGQRCQGVSNLDIWLLWRIP